MKAGIWLIDKIRGTDILEKYRFLVNESGSANKDFFVKESLAALLLAVKRNNPYYGKLLSQTPDELIKADPLKVHSTLPLIDKQEINNHITEFYKPYPGRKTQQKKTGGSTGSPFYYYVDKEHLSWFWAYIYFYWNRHSGYQPGDPFITIAGNSLRTSKAAFTESIYHRLQNNYFITGDIIDKDISVDHRKVSEAVMLYGYPSSIINMLAVKPGFPSLAKKIKAIFTTSEQLLPSVRSAIEEAFGLPVFDMYGANDGGILTCECSEHNGYHLNTRNCYAETFVNEFGMSELLLTNLNSYGFPLIRYRVGDLGKLETEPCNCGLYSPRITELKGRTRDVLKLKDGRTIHGSLFNKVFFHHTEIDGYKILQKEDHSITLFIHVKDKEKYQNLAIQVKNEITSLLQNVDIKIEPMLEMNPTNGKFKLIESHAI